MAIAEKVKLVEQLFDQLAKEMTTFQNTTSLSCVAGCGKCCTTPSIEASPLEFLPWAFHLYLNGEAEKTLEELKQKTTFLCHIYKPSNSFDNSLGRCSNYKYRGLICRLFGYAASKDKYGKLRIATCTIIKEGQSEEFLKTSQAISNGLKIPVFSDYYIQLSNIDFTLGKIMLPVNLALKMAIEEVLHYYAYRPFPKELKDIA
jgi:Fe-S-cluster containining protein